MQEVGVAAAEVQTARDQYERDPQLAARRFFETIDHALRGPVVANGVPLGLTGTPGRTTSAGAALGEDNDAVFGALLGIGTEELARLRAIGAIEDSDEPVPELPR